MQKKETDLNDLWINLFSSGTDFDEIAKHIVFLKIMEWQLSCSFLDVWLSYFMTKVSTLNYQNHTNPWYNHLS